MLDRGVSREYDRGERCGREMLTGEVGDPVGVAVAGEDDGVGDGVVVEALKDAQAVRFVAVPGVDIN